VRLWINGEEQNFACECNVSSLIRELRLEGRPIAIEINKHVLTKNDFDSTQLKDGDKLEIISFVGGG